MSGNLTGLCLYMNVLTYLLALHEHWTLFHHPYDKPDLEFIFSNDKIKTCLDGNRWGAS